MVESTKIVSLFPQPQTEAHSNFYLPRLLLEVQIVHEGNERIVFGLRDHNLPNEWSRICLGSGYHRLETILRQLTHQPTSKTHPLETNAFGHPDDDLGTASVRLHVSPDQ